MPNAETEPGIPATQPQAQFAAGDPAPAGAEAFAMRSRGVTTAELLQAIPRECFERHLSRELLGLASSIVVLAIAYAALALNPFWWLLPPVWFLAGTAAWGLYVVGHECGHGSFSRHRRLNRFVGHLMLTPFLYPFHSWRLLHNRHHEHTNSIENDLDWRPLPAVFYRRLPWRPRGVYTLIRTGFWWMGTLHHWATMAFDLQQFREGDDRQDVRFSILIVALYAGVFFPALLSCTGFWGVVKYWMVPWLIAHGWFSTITLTHHTHPEIPFLDRRHWSPIAANLTMTIYCHYPRWAEYLGHDINVHIPHHVAPTIPYYHLRRAHAALKQRWPHLVHEMQFSWRHLFRLLATCHLYDSKTAYYLPFSAGRRKRSARQQAD